MNNRLFLFFVIISILLSCSSLPEPSQENNSLLVLICTPEMGTNTELIDLDGVKEISLFGPQETRINLQSNNWQLQLKALPPGTYVIRPEIVNTEGLPQEIIVQPDTIILSPFYFIRNGEETFAAPIKPRQRELAIKELSTYIGFQNWYGKNFIGFGPFRPKMFLTGEQFKLNIVTTPPEADIILDGSEWGLSPTEIELTQGKYLLEIKKKGYSSYKKFISVDQDIQIEARLEEQKTEPEIQDKDKFNIMVLPFININAEEDNLYGTIFQDTMMLNFRENPRLAINKIDSAGINLEPENYPDLNAAEQIGSELLVAGEYLLKEEKIFVFATLYDVKSERIKFSEVYVSSAGFSIFEYIDEMSVDFVQAVSKVLPEVGKSIIEKEEDTTQEMISYEKKLFSKHIVNTRSQNANIFAVGLVLGGVMDQIEEVDGDTNLRTNQEGASFEALLKYERIIFPELSYSVALSVFLPINIRTTDITLYTGPQFNIKADTFDVYFSPVLGIAFCPAFDEYYENMETSFTYGPYYFLGSSLEMGLRFYFQEKITTLPFFSELGLYFDAFYFRFDNDFSNPAFVPMKLGLYGRLGVGL